jgi:hypothetical protein
MQCGWNQKILDFTHQGKHIKIQGLLPPPLKATPISANQLYNDTWAFVVVEAIPHSLSLNTTSITNTPTDLQQLLDIYADVFQDPQTLPPPKSYDHSIPLLPGALPINARPYHYSPQHKTEIENQVKQLLQSGFNTHSHSPFASPVLLVKKKDGT